jgi:hypothetical protein
MTEGQCLSSKINEGVKTAIARAIERHRKLGEPIAVWQNNKVIVLAAERIPQTYQNSPTQPER